jgi:hypothetical protein
MIDMVLEMHMSLEYMLYYLFSMYSHIQEGRASNCLRHFQNMRQMELDYRKLPQDQSMCLLGICYMRQLWLLKMSLAGRGYMLLHLQENMFLVGMQLA